MHLMDYVKMPQPLVVLGVMYVIFAFFNIINYLKDGYWHGILSGTIKAIVTNKLKFILFLCITILTITFIDWPISNLCKTFYNVDVYTATDFINSMGEGWFVSGILFTIAIILSSRNRIQDAIAFRIAFMTSIFAGLTNGVLKFIFNRERPVIGMDEWHFFHFFLTGAKKLNSLMYAYNSMPSGHTITVLSAVTVLYLCSQSKIAKAILIFFALAICYARVYTMNHWLSDVLVSTIIGITIGRISYNINKYRINKDYLKNE